MTLPPRRLAHQELPVGGYADVTTHGPLEQILPAQFALDEWDFFVFGLVKQQKTFSYREFTYLPRVTVLAERPLASGPTRAARAGAAFRPQQEQTGRLLSTRKSCRPCDRVTD